MRTPTEHVARDGTRSWKVKYRSAGVYTSETFRRKPDALTFAALLASGPNGVAEALGWLTERDKAEAAGLEDLIVALTDEIRALRQVHESCATCAPSLPATRRPEQ